MSNTKSKPSTEKCIFCGNNLTTSQMKISTFFDCKNCDKFETRILNDSKDIISARVYDHDNNITFTFNFLEDKLKVISVPKDYKKEKIDLEFPLPDIDWSNKTAVLTKINTILTFKD